MCRVMDDRGLRDINWYQFRVPGRGEVRFGLGRESCCLGLERNIGGDVK